MLRQDIRIGDYSNKGADLVTYKYIVDLYKAGVDFHDTIQSQYVMIRKYDVINDLVCDTDLYIIEKSLFEEHPEDIVYPMTNHSFVGFSNDKTSFNENLNDRNFKPGGYEVYELLKRNDDKSFTIADIPCDIVKVYHPDNRKELQSVIYIDTIVGSTKFHIYCRPYLSHESHSEEDFTIDSVHYSEYVECHVPDIEYLVSGAVYYEERISLLKTGLQTGDEVISDLVCTPENGLANDGVYAALKIYGIPFIIEEGTDGQHEQYKKYIIDINDTVAQDYVEFPLRVTIFPYDYIDDTTGIFLNTSNLEMNSDVMQDDAKMTLAATTGFDDSGMPSLVCTFQFPGKDSFSTFREAYEHFYRVDLNDYTGIIEYNEDDTDEEDYVEQKQCGFLLTVYTDFKMTSILYQEVFELDDPESQLDDFAFQLNGMFHNWDELPDTLIMEASFIDRWLGNVIASNPVVIHNESFKYLVNDDREARSIIKWEGTEQENHIIGDMDLSNINFIDKIHCTIRRKDNSGQGVTGNSGNGPRVLYKPVFYRVQDLQNVTLRAGLVQNVGIALAEYMTKVESFKMQIGEQSIVESARNDVYAIFAVNASVLSEGTGTYHISNQDGEYISSGKYTVIQ